MHATGQVTCPKCGQADAVRKVSALVADGTWTSESAGLGLGISRNSPELMAVAGSSISRSELAANLAPPRKPARPHGHGWTVTYGLGRFALVAFVGFLLICGVLISFPLFINTYSQTPLLILIPIAVVICYIVAAFWWLVRSSLHDVQDRNTEQVGYAGKLKAWQRRVSQWNDLYYCARDDGVFTLKQRFLVPLKVYRTNRSG